MPPEDTLHEQHWQAFLADFPEFLDGIRYAGPEQVREYFGHATDEPEMLIDAKTVFGWSVWNRFHRYGNQAVLREFVSVERAQQWLQNYDPKWMSDEVLDEIVKELQAGRKQRWYNAVIVDQTTDICREGLTRLSEIIKTGKGVMCWVARANDFHFSAVELEHTQQGPMLVTREMDRVHVQPLQLPYKIIDKNDLPPHLRDQS